MMKEKKDITTKRNTKVNMTRKRDTKRNIMTIKAIIQSMKKERKARKDINFMKKAALKKAIPLKVLRLHYDSLILGSHSMKTNKQISLLEKHIDYFFCL